MELVNFNRLKGKVALVFGAGSSGQGWGNGKASAVLYAREGAKVALIDINLKAALETKKIIEQEGNSSRAYQADIRSEKEIAEVIKQVSYDFGRIDILHNNVGITHMDSIVDLKAEDWHKVIDTNLTGVFLTCKHVIPTMLSQGSGTIINISSIASLQINAYPYIPYFAAKSGLNHLTRALAVEYAARGLRVNAILPGVMDTPLIYSQINMQFESQEAMILARHSASPMGRMGDAWDVARAALFLASDESKYITGVCLPVDGGKSCTGR